MRFKDAQSVDFDAINPKNTKYPLCNPTYDFYAIELERTEQNKISDVT